MAPSSIAECSFSYLFMSLFSCGAPLLDGVPAPYMSSYPDPALGSQHVIVYKHSNNKASNISGHLQPCAW
jgi:hypothetical protein